jgi:hypothetical protein
MFNFKKPRATPAKTVSDINEINIKGGGKSQSVAKAPPESILHPSQQSSSAIVQSLIIYAYSQMNAGKSSEETIALIIDHGVNQDVASMIVSRAGEIRPPL